MTIVRAFIAALLLLASTPVSAVAVTPDELVALTRSGLSVDVLLALIETTGVERPIDANGALELRRAGVSQQVIAAAIRASHRRPGGEDARQAQLGEPMPSDEPPANIAVIGGASEPSPVVVEREIYYVPWLVGVPVHPGPLRKPQPYFTGDRGFGRFINDGTSVRGIARHERPAGSRRR